MKAPSSHTDTNIDPDLLPRAAATGEPLLPSPQPGYYPGYSTLGQQKFWDATTRELVVHRVADPPPLRFFTPEQAQFWKIVFDHLIPQTDRTPERQIPLIPPLDKRLHENRTVGYRFENMPHDRDVYTRYGIEAIDFEAQEHYGKGFLALPWLEQDLVLRTIHDGHPRAADYIWKKMSVHRFWAFLMQDAIDAYYAHPWAWDEIGFGGPAYHAPISVWNAASPSPGRWRSSRTTGLVRAQRYRMRSTMLPIITSSLNSTSIRL